MVTLSSEPRFTEIDLVADSAGPFDIGFRLFSETELDVYVDKVRVTNWSITADLEHGFDDDATLTFTAPVSAGSTIRIDSFLRAVRAADYTAGPNLVATMNLDLGRMTAMIADVRSKQTDGIFNAETAEAAAIRAETAQDAAETAEAAALASQTAAASSASGASVSAAQAATSASSAATSQSAAATSATNAAASAATAAAEAADAVLSAASAQSSEISAAGSATTATNNKNLAQGFALDAEIAKDAAETSETAAAASASGAAASASSASSSASAAASSASSAASSASSAAGSASSAAGSATTAANNADAAYERVRDLVPSTFTDGNLFWTTQVDLAPDSTAPVTDGKFSFTGTSAVITMAASTAIQIGPRGVVRTETGRTYRTTLWIRQTAGTLRTGNINIVERRHNDAYSSNSQVSPVSSFSLSALNTWEKFTSEYTNTAHTFLNFRSFLNIPIAGAFAGDVYEVRSVIVEDVTVELAAAGDPLFFGVRNGTTAGQAAAYANGTIVMIAGDLHQVDSAATGTASATNDLGVNGLRYFGALKRASIAAVLADTRTFYPVGTVIIGEREAQAYTVVASGQDVTTAGGVLLDVEPMATGDFSVVAFGAAGDNAADDTAELQAAVNKATPLGRYVDGVGRTYFVTDEIDIPVGIVGTGSYARNQGPRWRNLKMRTSITSGVAIKGNGHGGLPGRQYFGVHFDDVKVQGPGTGTASAFGPANYRLPVYERCAAYGFPGGAGIDGWASGSGGAYGLVAAYCEFGYQEFVTRSGQSTVDIATELFPNAVKYGILGRGPGAASGKWNDPITIGNFVYCALGAAYKQSYHGAYSGDGGSGNWRDFGSVIVSGMPRHIDQGEAGGASAAVSATSTTLVVPVKTGCNDTSGDYVDCVLYINTGTGAGQYRRITSDVISGANRTLTVAAWDTVPNPADCQWYIIYGEASYFSEFGLANFPNGMMWDHSYGLSSFGTYIEETCAPFLGGDNANDDIAVIAPISKISGGEFMKWKSGAEYEPSVYISTRADTDDDIPANVILTGTLHMRPQGTGVNSDHAITSSYTNHDVVDLEHGDVVRISTTGAARVVKATGSNESDVYIVCSPGGGPFPPGSKVPVAGAGIGFTTVKITGTVNEGDTLISAAGGVAQAGVPTSDDCVVGRAVTAGSGGTCRARPGIA